MTMGAGDGQDEHADWDEYTPPLATHHDLKGRSAIVTGAARNIGTAIAANLAQQGMRLVVVDLDAGPLAEVAGRLADLGCDCRPVVADLTTPAGADAALATAVEAFGMVDGVVNNAAIRTGKSFLEMDDATWARTFEGNMRMVQLLSQRAARHMIDGGIGGAFVHISSIGAMRPHRYCAGYDAAKAALEHFSRIMADSLGPQGIRSNVVAPGAMCTRPPQGGPIRRRFPEHPKTRNLVPLGRKGEMAEVAAAAAFLLSAASGYTTGAVLPVDGGVGIPLTPQDTSF